MSALDLEKGQECISFRLPGTESAYTMNVDEKCRCRLLE